MANEENKYQEVLERAKKELNACCSQDCDAARQIFRFFPELKKNKDERIKKEIVDYLKKFIPHCDCDLVKKSKEWIAWLENQCEEKHKFIIGDIISNGKVEFRVDNIVKNSIGQYCYFLVNIESEKNGTRYYRLHDLDGKTYNSGETIWVCEEVDTKFEKQGEKKSESKELKKIGLKPAWNKENEEYVSIVEHDGDKYVRVCALGEDFLIASHDYKDGDKKVFTWEEACKIGTFTKKQIIITLAIIDEINAKLKEIGGDKLICIYWCYTEYDTISAWYVNFNGTYYYTNYKTCNYCVRKIKNLQ